MNEVGKRVSALQPARSAGNVASICYAIIIVVVIADAVDDLTNWFILTLYRYNIYLIIYSFSANFCDRLQTFC